jgi:hypothetical protein
MNQVYIDNFREKYKTNHMLSNELNFTFLYSIADARGRCTLIFHNLAVFEIHYSA